MKFCHQCGQHYTKRQIVTNEERAVRDNQKHFSHMVWEKDNAEKRKRVRRQAND